MDADRGLPDIFAPLKDGADGTSTLRKNNLPARVLVHCYGPLRPKQGSCIQWLVLAGLCVIKKPRPRARRSIPISPIQLRRGDSKD